MAGDYGAAFVERDRAARLLLYRGNMAAEYACYGADAEARIAAFTAGINAYVDLVEREPERLPLEFRATGTTPARWSPEDVVRCRSHARVRNADSEVTRSAIVARFGVEADRLHRDLQPDWTLQIPAASNPTPVFRLL